MKPLAIDLFAGLGGWTEGLLAEGYDVIGFDIERHEYDGEKYPAQLVLQDVLTIHGSQFKNADLIVASPPCQKYSYMAMPWTKAKELRAWYLADPARQVELNALFNACFRIQREAIAAAGHFIPLVVENVRGAQEWVGRSRWNFGSFHLWGDVPALMPMARAIKNSGGSWFNIAHNTGSGCGNNPDGRKSKGQDWSRFARTGEVSPHWNVTAAGVKHHGSGEVWFDTGPASLSSKSKSRKAASARIAKIPFVLSQHIARTYYPIAAEVCA